MLSPSPDVPYSREEFEQVVRGDASGWPAPAGVVRRLIATVRTLWGDPSARPPPTPVIYYREGKEVPHDEIPAMRESFRCVNSRLGVRPGEVCVARYSALPFYQDLEADLAMVGARLINSYRQHRWVADLGNWVEYLGDLTPRTWRRLEDVPEEAFPIVVKGETNSKKFLWDTHFFAATRGDAIKVVGRLYEDGLISDQWLYFRQYVPLHTYMIGLRDMPVTEEYRVFVYRRKVLSKGYYWTNYIDDLPTRPDPESIPEDFLADVLERIGENVTFYAVDVARKADGGWMVVEINDGQMSGPSDNDPKILYSALARAFHANPLL